MAVLVQKRASKARWKMIVSDAVLLSYTSPGIVIV